MTTPRRAALILVPALLLAPSALAAPAEGPTEGDCDASGLLVCAGADAGANVACLLDPQGVATCTWTYGWLTTAYSPLQLGGAERHVADVLVSLCIDGEGCFDAPASIAAECSWSPAGSCDHAYGSAPETFAIALAMGQCVRVAVDVTIAIDARAEAPLAGALGSVLFTNQAEGAGAACRVDDGR